MSVRDLIRRLVSWPVFAALAVLHLAVLPLVLSEHEDVVLSMVAGVGYALLAALDLVLRRRARAEAAGRPPRSIDGRSWR